VKAHWTGRIGGRPKMIVKMSFDFSTEGSRLTGIAHMSGWPSDCPMRLATVFGPLRQFVLAHPRSWRF